MLGIVVGSRGCNRAERCNYDCERCPKQAGSSVLGKRAAAGGNALLSAQEWGFLLIVQIEQASVIQFIARRSVGRGVQLFLDGGTTSSRHQARSIVVGTAEQIHYNFSAA